MTDPMTWVTTYFGSDPQVALAVVANLILLESLLSVDNAAVLATMVMDLPEHQRGKALRYGIIGAYVFRGLALIFAASIIELAWLKALGGLYLLWLAVDHFRKHAHRYGKVANHLFVIASIAGFLVIDPNRGWLVLSIKLLMAGYALLMLWDLLRDGKPGRDGGSKAEALRQNPAMALVTRSIGAFWGTVVAIELIDLAFSLDNVFAAVAFTDKIGLICTGVFIGILAMRVAAQFFVKLLEKYPGLEVAAYAVIGILGMKLVVAYLCELPDMASMAGACHLLHGEKADLFTSLTTLLVFVAPIVWSQLRQGSAPES